MRLRVLVVRRFVERVHRQDHVTEARRAVELPFAPSPGMILAFSGGSGECVVSKIRLRVQPAGGAWASSRSRWRPSVARIP